LANRHREAKLAVCRRLLLVLTAAVLLAPATPAEPAMPPCCPACGGTRWQRGGDVPPVTTAPACTAVAGRDTS